MYASVKNKGRSIGSIIETYIGKTGKKLFLLFCWLFCILVVAAFADVVAGTFNGFLTADDGTVSKITANGAVATTSMLFIIEAVCLGMILRYGKLHKWVNTADVSAENHLACDHLHLHPDRIRSSCMESAAAS